MLIVIYGMEGVKKDFSNASDLQKKLLLLLINF